MKCPLRVNRFVVLSFLCIGALALAMGFTLSTLLTRAVSEWEWENTAATIRWGQIIIWTISLTGGGALYVLLLRNVRLRETLNNRFASVRILASPNQLILSSLDTKEVLGGIARAAAQLMNVPLVSFWVVEEATKTLELRAFSDDQIGADYPIRRLSFAQGAVG
jgi:hypothetical protein